MWRDLNINKQINLAPLRKSVIDPLLTAGMIKDLEKLKSGGGRGLMKRVELLPACYSWASSQVDQGPFVELSQQLPLNFFQSHYWVWFYHSAFHKENIVTWRQEFHRSMAPCFEWKMVNLKCFKTYQNIIDKFNCLTKSFYKFITWPEGVWKRNHSKCKKDR